MPVPNEGPINLTAFASGDLLCPCTVTEVSDAGPRYRGDACQGNSDWRIVFPGHGYYVTEARGVSRCVLSSLVSNPRNSFPGLLNLTISVGIRLLHQGLHL